MCHFDADQAFVQSKLDEILFVRLPQGRGPLLGKVVRLSRSLYGLKQASRTWHHHLFTVVRGMKSLGFYQSAADACGMRSIENNVLSRGLWYTWMTFFHRAKEQV